MAQSVSSSDSLILILKEDSKLPIASSRLTDLRPFAKVELTLSWQQNAAAWLLNQQFSASSAIWNISGSGITTPICEFCEWMQHSYPESTAFFPVNLPPARKVKQILQKCSKRGWNGKFLIINLVQQHNTDWWEHQAETLQLLRCGALMAQPNMSMGQPPAGILIFSELPITSSERSGFNTKEIHMSTLEDPIMLHSSQPEKEEGDTELKQRIDHPEDEIEA